MLALGVLLGGCASYRIREYAPLTIPLDGRNELHISTYPAWFPQESSDIPFLKKTIRTPESVYFQVFVRDAQRRAGPNPNVESIRIASFSYQIPGQAPVVLIQDHDANVWMQDQPQYNPRESTPVPWVAGQALTVAISLQLNGTSHELTTQMQAVERERTGSLIAHTFLR